MIWNVALRATVDYLKITLTVSCAKKSVVAYNKYKKRRIFGKQGIPDPGSDLSDVHPKASIHFPVFPVR